MTSSTTSSIEGNPQEFDAYWQATMAELSRLPTAPEVEEIPLRSAEFATAYGVQVTSIGPYRIFGYLSIPHGQGPFPARYFLPRYGSVADIVPQGTSNNQRRQYVTLAICARGQRGSDRPYAASFPGQLTDGVDSPEGYIYRGIVADCCRGLEYLLQRPEVDQTRIAAIGTDMALVTAALCPQITHLVCTPVLFHRTLERAANTQAYPLEEINDYLRQHADRQEKVADTLAHYDLRRFAPKVRATTLLMAEARGSALDPSTLELMAQDIQGQTLVHESENSGFKDGAFSETWLSEQLGLPEPSLPPHWQARD